MHTDSWAVSPAAEDDAYFRAAAAIGGAGALTLLQSTLGPNGVGYKLIINSTGNDGATTYTIVGAIVGQTTGTTTVTQAGGNTGTPTTSTNYWARIDSISASGAATGNVKIGFTGALALPRTRIRGVHYVGAAAAGTIVVTMNGTSGTVLLNVDTPASVAFAEYVACGHILVGRSAAQSDYAVVTLTQVTKCTLFCS